MQGGLGNKRPLWRRFSFFFGSFRLLPTCPLPPNFPRAPNANATPTASWRCTGRQRALLWWSIGRLSLVCAFLGRGRVGSGGLVSCCCFVFGLGLAGQLAKPLLRPLPNRKACQRRRQLLSSLASGTRASITCLTVLLFLGGGGGFACPTVAAHWLPFVQRWSNYLPSLLTSKDSGGPDATPPTESASSPSTHPRVAGGSGPDATTGGGSGPQTPAAVLPVAPPVGSVRGAGSSQALPSTPATAPAGPSGATMPSGTTSVPSDPATKLTGESPATAQACVVPTSPFQGAVGA